MHGHSCNSRSYPAYPLDFNTSGLLDSFHSLPEPRELKPSTELGAVRLQTERNRLKLEVVETALTSLHKRLEDMGNGLEDMRLKLGTLELEHRFVHALRAKSLKVEATQNAGIPHDPSFTVTGSSGLAHAGDTLTESSQTDMVVNSARLEAIEAVCQDLRLDIQEVTSVPAATEQLLKCELNHAVGNLREELQVIRNMEEEQHTLDLLRVEKAGTELRRRLEEAEQQIREVQQAEVKQELGVLRSELQQERGRVAQNSISLNRADVAGMELSQRIEVHDLRMQDLQQALEGQGVEVAVLRTRLETAVRECSEQLAHSSELQALVREDQHRRGAEATTFARRMDAMEQVARDSVDMSKLLARIERLERSNSTPGGAGPAPLTAPKATTSNPGVDSQITEVTQGELGHSRVMLLGALGSSPAEAVQEALPERPEGTGRAPAEVRTSRLDEVSELSERIEEVVGMHTRQLASINELRSHLVQETEALHFRLHAMEQLPSVAGVAVMQSSSTSYVPEIDTTFSATTAGSPGRPSGRSFLASSSGASPMASPMVAADSAIEELRAALKATCADVATLARNLATVQEEHDGAITSIGTLTEFVARAVASSIQRKEAFSSERDGLEQADSAHCEAAHIPAKNVLVEVAQQDPATAEGGGKEGANPLTPECINMATIELWARASAKAAAAEVHINTVEQTLGADLKRMDGMLAACAGQLENTQVEMHNLRPRVSALEATVGVTVGTGSAAEGVATGGTPGRQEASPRPAKVPSKLPLAALAVPGRATKPAMGSPSSKTEVLAQGRRCSPTRTLSDGAMEAARGLGSSPLPCRPRSPAVGSRWVEDVPALRFHRAGESVNESVAGQGGAEVPAGVRGTHAESAAGMKEKLEGIVSSVYHVLGALNLGEAQLEQLQQLPQWQGPQPQRQPLQPELTGAKAAEAQPLSPSTQQQHPAQPKVKMATVLASVPVPSPPSPRRDPPLRMTEGHGRGFGSTACLQMPACEQRQTSHSQASCNFLPMQSACYRQPSPSERYQGQQLEARCLQSSHSEKHLECQEQAARCLRPSPSDKHLEGQEQLGAPQQGQSSPTGARPSPLHVLQRSDHSPHPALSPKAEDVSSPPLRSLEHSPPPTSRGAVRHEVLRAASWCSPLPQQVGSVAPALPQQHDELLPGPPPSRHGPRGQSQQRLPADPSPRHHSTRAGPGSSNGQRSPLQAGNPPPVVRQGTAPQMAMGRHGSGRSGGSSVTAPSGSRTPGLFHGVSQPVGAAQRPLDTSPPRVAARGDGAEATDRPRARDGAPPGTQWSAF